MKADVFENEFLQSQLIDYLHQVDGDKIDMRSGMSLMLMLAAILREQGAISYSEIGHSMELIANQIKSFDLHWSADSAYRFYCNAKISF